MLKKLMEKLQSWAAANKIKFDPSGIGDPVAMLTEWTPAKSGGANFRTHKIVSADPNRLEFKSSMGAKAFFLIFIIMGITVMAAFSSCKFVIRQVLVHQRNNHTIIDRLRFYSGRGCDVLFRHITHSF